MTAGAVTGPGEPFLRGCGPVPAPGWWRPIEDRTLAGGRAVFVRLLSGPDGDADLAISTVQRVVDLVGGWADLNEFKQTVVPY